MNFLDQVLKAMNSAESQAVIIAMILEFVFRYVKSSKPLGILHAASSVMKKLSEVLAKLAELSDKVLPQNLINADSPSVEKE